MKNLFKITSTIDQRKIIYSLLAAGAGLYQIGRNLWKNVSAV